MSHSVSTRKTACQRFLNLLFTGKNSSCGLDLTRFVFIEAFMGYLSFIEDAFLLLEEDNAIIFDKLGEKHRARVLQNRQWEQSKYIMCFTDQLSMSVHRRQQKILLSRWKYNKQLSLYQTITLNKNSYHSPDFKDELSAEDTWTSTLEDCFFYNSRAPRVTILDSKSLAQTLIQLPNAIPKPCKVLKPVF